MEVKIIKNDEGCLKLKKSGLKKNNQTKSSS
jgi:hypothetical protein